VADTETGKVPELLPCPFCGSVGAFVRNDATNSDATVQCCNVECAAAQAGWKLVPQEPTEAMIAAGAEEDQWTINEGQDTCAREIYKAMLAAAPSPPGHATDGKANEYGRRYQNH